MSLLYTASAVTYATRIPERFLPGKCDIWVSINTSRAEISLTISLMYVRFDQFFRKLPVLVF